MGPTSPLKGIALGTLVPQGMTQSNEESTPVSSSHTEVSTHGETVGIATALSSASTAPIIVSTGPSIAPNYPTYLCC